MNIHKKGFTLTEVLITVVIIAVLASIALPIYFQTVEQSRSNEAKSNLNVIYTAEKIYLLNNNTFWPAGGTDAVLADINTNLNVDLTENYYTISVTAGAGAGPAATFTATASRGNPGNKQFTIDNTFNGSTYGESGSY